MENVLVIPRSQFQRAGFFRGFQAFSPEYAAKLLDPDGFEFRPRHEVETDTNYLQVIPYLLLRFEGQVFHYQRGGAGTEKRLTARRSVGIGGHINDFDFQLGSDVYRLGMLRELREEVTHAPIASEQTLGMIYDDATPVGEVHLGIVEVIDLNQPFVQPNEPAIEGLGFATVQQLLQEPDGFESWSILALTALLGE
jgi:predicted NUDIX family phosphoesterase